MCHITRQASIKAQRNSLIPNRNRQASSPLIDRLKLPYHKRKEKTEIHKLLSAQVYQQKIPTNEIRTYARTNQRRALTNPGLKWLSVFSFCL